MLVVKMVKPRSFEVIAGTYEEFLLGYNYSSKDNLLVQSFAAHDHAASIRAVALSGHYIASGAADDRIFVYDLKSRKEHCSLTYHNATVTCLEFTPNHTHLISGSADGVLAIVRVGNWQLEKSWEKAHKGAAVLDIAVHSTGKLALTLGGDGSLVTWNLVKGRQAFIINLNSKCKDVRALERIFWADDDVRFVLYGGKYTEIWSIESGGPLKQIEHTEKVTSCFWLAETTLLVGHENGDITVLNTEDNSRKIIKAHESRVKSIGCHKKRIVTLASGGDIKIWNKSFEQLAKIDTGCRLTCLCVVPPIDVKEENKEIEEINTVESAETPIKKKKNTKSQVVEVIEEQDEEIVQKPVKKKKKKNKASLIT